WAFGWPRGSDVGGRTARGNTGLKRNRPKRISPSPPLTLRQAEASAGIGPSGTTGSRVRSAREVRGGADGIIVGGAGARGGGSGWTGARGGAALIGGGAGRPLPPPR